MPTTRHLRPVPDNPDDVPTGLMWQASEAENARYTQVAEELRTTTDTPENVPASEPLPPLEGHVYDSSENNGGALSPAKANLAEVNDKLKAALESAHTYALLAWNRRWEVAMDYVMDPALRQQMLDAAEEDLDNKIADAEKAVRRSNRPEDTARANKKLKRLERREISELEVDARVLRARTIRLATRCAIPAGVIVGPVLLAASGMWWGLLAWPAAWGWLALQGRAMARAESTTTATVTPVDNTAVTGAPAPV